MLKLLTFCLADPQKIRLKARLSDDISEVMSYLNATVKNAFYNHDAPHLTLSRDGKVHQHPQINTDALRKKPGAKETSQKSPRTSAMYPELLMLRQL